MCNVSICQIMKSHWRQCATTIQHAFQMYNSLRIFLSIKKNSRIMHCYGAPYSLPYSNSQQNYQTERL